MIHKLRPDDPPGLAKYNFAGLFVAIAVEDALAALEPLPSLKRQTGDELTAWVKRQHPAIRMQLRRRTTVQEPLPEEIQSALDALVADQRRAEDRALYATSSAILMAAIHLESAVNVFLHHNFGDKVSDTIESLQYGRKFALAYALRGADIPTKVNVGVRELVKWRNDFVHGKPTERPGNLQQRLPPRDIAAMPLPREVAMEMIHLLRGFLDAARGLMVINRSAEYIPMREMYDAVNGYLDQCEKMIAGWAR